MCLSVLSCCGEISLVLPLVWVPQHIMLSQSDHRMKVAYVAIYKMHIYKCLSRDADSCMALGVISFNFSQ